MDGPAVVAVGSNLFVANLSGNNGLGEIVALDIGTGLPQTAIDPFSPLGETPLTASPDGRYLYLGDRVDRAWGATATGRPQIRPEHHNPLRHADHTGDLVLHRSGHQRPRPGPVPGPVRRQPTQPRHGHPDPDDEHLTDSDNVSDTDAVRDDATDVLESASHLGRELERPGQHGYAVATIVVVAAVLLLLGALLVATTRLRRRS